MTRPCYLLLLLAALGLSTPTSAQVPTPQNPIARILTGDEFAQTLTAQKGAVVVVHFWATWCQPCLGELPLLAKLAEKYKPEGVVFLPFSLDDPTPKQAAHVARILRAKVRDAAFSPILSLEPSPRFLARWLPDWEGDIPAFFVFDPAQKLRGVHIGNILPGEFQALVKAGRADYSSGSP
jgi:thiol-disulfide isomerase/thioredoxin